MVRRIIRILPKLALGIVAFYIAFTTVYSVLHRRSEPIKVIQADEMVTSDHYIVSKDFVLGKLQSKSQIVSFEQELKNITFTDVDESWAGNRHTEMTLQGTYKMGLATSDIHIKHIDSNGVVYIELPEPILISLELPYDQIIIEKTQGWLRIGMNEEEKKSFYKLAEASIRNDIMSNKETLKQADAFNQAAVKEIVAMLPTIRGVVFE